MPGQPNSKIGWEQLRGLFAFICAIGLIPFATPEAARAASNEVEFLHQIWRSDDGLPCPVVKSVIQDRQGYLWLGTDEGLVRFDGVQFREIEKRTSTRRNDRWLVALTETHDGSIWTTGAQGGLSRFKDGQHTRFPVEGRSVFALCEDKAGTLWIGTSLGLQSFKDGKFQIHTNQPGLIAAPVRSILEDKNGTLWIGTSSGLAFLRDGKFTTFATRNADGIISVMSLCEDRAGGLWVGTSAGLIHIVNGEARHFTTKDGLLHKIVRSVLEDKAGNIWIGTQGGLQLFDDGHFSTVKLQDDFSMDFEGISFIYALCEDKEGDIWVGTNLGISRLKPKKFKVISQDEGLSHNVATLVMEDRKGDVWVGTYGGGLCRILPDHVEVIDSSKGLPSDYVLSLWEDKNGAMWIGTDGAGLVHFQDGKFQRYSVKDPAANTIRVIFTDSAGNIWLGSNAGVYRLENGVMVRTAVVERTIIKCITEDSAGNVWFGTRSGLVQWKDGQVLKTYTQTNGLPSEAITSVFEDSNGFLWVATEAGGLNLMDKTNGRFAASPAGFEERVMHILEGNRDQLWLSTHNGIFCAKKSELTDYAQHKINAVNFTSFGRRDGLRRAQCNGIAQPAGWKTREGRVWFPTMHGAVSFNPSQMNSNHLPPPVVIEQISVDGHPLAMDGLEVEAPPGRGQVEIQFTALSFQAPEKVRFQYKLEGIDSQWVDAGTRRLAHFSSLRPGSYCFEVRACNNDGVWSNKTVSVDFVLLPHFYQTHSFFILCGLSVIGFGMGAHRIRLTRVKKRQEELARTVEERTANLQEMIKSMESLNYSIAHDLRAPIRAIRGFTEALIEDYKPGLDSVGCEYAQRIGESVDRMDHLIQDILTYGQLSHKDIPLESVSLDELLPRVVQHLHAEIESRKAIVELRLPIPSVRGNSTILEQVFTNLISNGIKFVPPGITPHLEIWSERSNSGIKIFVRDNGIGIKPEHHARIFRIFERLHPTGIYPGTGIGLAIVHRGMERLGGKVGLQSELQKGSCFWLELPATS